MNTPNSPIGRPSCVLLDLDNTLYEYNPCHESAMAAVRKSCGENLGLGEQAFTECYSQARVQIKDALGQTASSHSRLLYFQRTLELAGIGSQPNWSLMLEQIYWREFLHTSVLFPGVESFLDDLRIANCTTIVVTDLTAQIQMRKFLYWGLDRYIDWLVTSEETGFDKPHKDIFSTALAKVGGTEGNVWMIGDNYEKDSVGAKHSVSAITFLRTIDPADAAKTEVDFTFQSFEQLRQILAQSTESL